MTQPLPLRRLSPTGRVIRPEEGISVVATVRWGANGSAEVLAKATAWTANAVEITWILPGSGSRVDWVPADDISRTPPVFTPPSKPPIARPRSQQ